MGKKSNEVSAGRLISNLKGSYATVSGQGIEFINQWTEDSQAKIRKVKKRQPGLTDERIAELVGCSVEVLTGKKVAKEEGDKTVSLAEIKEAYKKVKEQKKGKNEAVTAWQKNYGPEFVRIMAAGTTFNQIWRVIGSSPNMVGRALLMAGRENLVPKYVIKALGGGKSKEKQKETPSESIGSQPPTPPVYGLDFWQGLAETGKTGEIMELALKNFFNSKAEFIKQASAKIEDLEEKNKILGEDLASEKEAHKATKKELAEANGKLKNGQNNTESRKKDLSDAVNTAFVIHGDHSLNDGKEKCRA